MSLQLPFLGLQLPFLGLHLILQLINHLLTFFDHLYLSLQLVILLHPLSFFNDGIYDLTSQIRNS